MNLGYIGGLGLRFRLADIMLGRYIDPCGIYQPDQPKKQYIYCRLYLGLAMGQGAIFLGCEPKWLEKTWLETVGLKHMGVRVLKFFPFPPENVRISSRFLGHVSGLGNLEHLNLSQNHLQGIESGPTLRLQDEQKHYRN